MRTLGIPLLHGGHGGRWQDIAAARIGTSVIVIVLTLLGALPLVANAQFADRVPRVGYLSAATAGNDTVDSFRQGLRELGYIQGRNVLLEYRWGEGRFDRLPVLAAELVRLGVNVIVAANTPAALAAKGVTSTIPIILVTSGDPVGSGLVASLARPGGNVTGLSLTPSPSIIGKQLALLKEAFPTIAQVAVLANLSNQPTADLLTESELAARSLGVRLRVVPVREPKDFGGAFDL